MFSLLPLLAVPLVVMLGFKILFNSTFTLKEFFLSETIIIVVLCMAFFAGRHDAMSDIEVLSGHIVGKTSGSQGCCHCRQVCDKCSKRRCDTDGKNCRTVQVDCNCHQVCDHIQDYWWSLQVSTGDTLPVSYCESRKSNVPPLWVKAYVGEPAAVEHSYTNYLLADPDSVFSHQDEEADYSDVPLPPRVHGLYRINSALNIGTQMSVETYNQGLMDINDALGHKKQVHIILVATTNTDPAWVQHMEEAWLHGKKNQVVFVVGAPDGDTIEWARVFSFSNIAALQIHARDTMPGMSLADAPSVLRFISTSVEEKFTRTAMAEYEYLASAAQPPPWLMIFLWILGIGGSMGLSFFMHVKDVFGDEGHSFRNY